MSNGYELEDALEMIGLVVYVAGIPLTFGYMAAIGANPMMTIVLPFVWPAFWLGHWGYWIGNAI